MTRQLRIVGIGASAGGIEAMRGFFQNMLPSNGMGFVVVLHLSPDRTSMLPEVLGHWTAMPVEQATDGTRVAADHVYVIAPNMLMTIEHGCLRLRGPAVPMRESRPIDVFFTALAADQGRCAIGVVLSGTGSDGALGLKAIKECGGVSLAQGGDATGPLYPGMPNSAIATGAVDLILPVEAMPARILDLPARPDAPGDESPVPEGERIAAASPAICAILQDRVGHDFSGYKQQSFIRRVQRRMLFLALDIDGYLQCLRSDPHEADLLFHELLIGVTAFFRDQHVFDAVQQTVVPQLFERKDAAGSVRIWVPGCSTGEEAYSFAMLMLEHAATLKAPPRIQILATDIDEAAVGLARAGRYPALLLQDVSPERLARFFVAGDGTYQVSKPLREVCTFSPHSVIRDPPFSRIDLISCRNLLIYLDADLQGRVMHAFHYALAPGGFLLLGNSEMMARHGELFAPVDRTSRIFRRRSTRTPALYVSPVAVAGGRSATGRLRPPSGPGREAVADRANRRILDRFAPPFVVVNGEGEVLHFSARTGRYLEPAAGVPSRDVVAMARRGLRLDMLTALRRAFDTGQTIRRERIEVELNGGTQPITLTVEPLAGQGSERLFMVVFSDTGAMRAPDAAAGRTDAPPGDQGAPAYEETIEQMGRELRTARDQVESTTEQYEAALGELNATNEELQSVVEELQSTNEELETSREEMQSMNEELQTVNGQLTVKVDDLDRANSDLRNLFESTRVATVFLDRLMVIRGFTPAVAGIYNLIPSDVGRPFGDIASQIDYPDLGADVGTVLDRRDLLERSVARCDGTANYLMRMLPYRTTDNRVDGVVVTFVDVTSLVQAELHQRMLVSEMNHRVRNMLTVVISLATQTLHRSTTLEDFSEAFLGRVNGMASAYTLLSRENWAGVAFRDVLEEQVRPFVADGGDHVTLEGPPVFLKPRGALALGLVIHELVTNAVKYGGLSVPDGTLTARWESGPNDQEKQVILRWTEHGGPPAAAPDQTGFGLAMIRRIVEHELNGRAAMDFASTGLEATLTVALDPTIANAAATRRPGQ